jgi:hypothetical protein
MNNTPESIELVPLSLIADELGMSRGEFEYRYGADVTVDDIGLRCIPAPVAKRIIADRAAAEAVMLEAARKRDAEAEANWRPPVGVPAIEGLTAFQTVMANEPPPEWKTRVSPAQEFLDNIGKPQ